MVIFNSYVKLPEGTWPFLVDEHQTIAPKEFPAIERE
jgi:hypothetical protein